MQLSDASFVVVDVETTGMSPSNDRITEIAMLRVERGKIGDRFETLIHPGRSIPSFIAEYTGITNAMVFGKPQFGDLIPEIAGFLGKSERPIFVGHNVQFDKGFVLQSFLRAKSNHPIAQQFSSIETLCTCRLSKRLTKLERRSLKHVADHFGIRIKARHRAMGDAEATARVLLEFLAIAEEDYEVDELEELLRLQFKKPTPARKTSVQRSLEEEVREFPRRAGVYVMSDARGNVIYVGKANDLRERVSSYFASSSIRSRTKQSRMMKAVRSIRIEETGSELSALLKESRMIKELKPQFNSLERRWKSSAFLRLDVQNLFPRLDAIREPALDGAEYYGPFRSRASVEALIEVMNRSFKLRECEGELKVDASTRPCFYYDIGRCNAPCAMKESAAEYGGEVDRFRKFLAAGEKGILSLVEEMMADAAERLEYEEAHYLKLRLNELKKVLGSGERPFASINGYDCVLVSPADAGKAEIFFVRFGRLVKQIVLTKENLPTARQWFERQLRQYYPAGSSAIPPECGKPEIDEMRILASWIERKRDDTESAIVYIRSDDAHLVEDLMDALARVLAEATQLAPSSLAVREPKKTSNASFSPAEVRTAKRLTLKPMYPKR